MEVTQDETAKSDFAIIAPSAVASEEGVRCAVSAGREMQRPACFLMAPMGERACCTPDGECRPTAVIHKPLRELSLLETLLRELSQKREDTAAALRPLAEQLGERRGGLVLVAEDNKVNQHVIRRMLEKLGYQVAVVENGHEALEAVSERRYSLVLMDCQMPGMDGFEATAAIREMPAPHCHVPIIAVTAHAIHGDRERCIQAGMDDYITKPIMLGDLGDVVGRWIDRSGEARAVRQERNTPAID